MKDKELERLYKAFANRRRIAIVRMLQKGKEVSVGDIASAIKLSFNATSKHLSVLSAANMLDKEQRSLQIFYRIADELSDQARKALSIL